jgi:hypothetical protein
MRRTPIFSEPTEMAVVGGGGRISLCIILVYQATTKFESSWCTCYNEASEKYSYAHVEYSECNYRNDSHHQANEVVHDCILHPL